MCKIVSAFIADQYMALNVLPNWSSLFFVSSNTKCVLVAAASLLRQLNPAIDPCEDFYVFSVINTPLGTMLSQMTMWTDKRDLKGRVLASKYVCLSKCIPITPTSLMYKGCSFMLVICLINFLVDD